MGMPKWMEGLKLAKPTRKPNYTLIPINDLDMDDGGMGRFNEISLALRSSGWHRILRTPSGGISVKSPRPCYDIRRTNYCVEITALTPWGSFRAMFANAIDGVKMRGRQAFRLFRKELMRDGVDLTIYGIDDKEECLRQKEAIEKPPIGFAMPGVEDITWRNVNHIDFRSSYPAGLAERYPEMRPTIERVYRRKMEGDAEAKAMLNMAIGFMQSVSGCNARWAKLARLAIEASNDRVYALARELVKAGRMPLCYNTDGIWYAGEVFHGRGEGDALGDWHNDHVKCVWRAKSAGAYEYVEGGAYTAVVRGVKAERKEGWRWGSIYGPDAVPSVYEYDDEQEVISKHGEID